MSWLSGSQVQLIFLLRGRNEAQGDLFQIRHGTRTVLFHSTVFPLKAYQVNA
jgi:hypothetical protein